MSITSELTLLYVEDDTALREQFVRILRAKFKEIYEASDGLQALEMYEEYSPDMMLVDINLPKIDGLKVIERVRKYDKTIPIVILSAYSDETKLFSAIKLGLSEYLVKPVPHKKLLDLLNHMAVMNKTTIEDKNVIVLKGDYFWKKKEKMLCYGEESIALTKREMIFLEFMVEQVDEIVSLDSIGNLIWEDEESQIAYSSLSHLLKRLKKKLPAELIENIYGEGYRVTST
ncbi:MAG: response regulator [Sulfurovum sp.]|nr:response regulator [Sulfurovum sp.]